MSGNQETATELRRLRRLIAFERRRSFVGTVLQAAGGISLVAGAGLLLGLAAAVLAAGALLVIAGVVTETGGA